MCLNFLNNSIAMTKTCTPGGFKPTTFCSGSGCDDHYTSPTEPSKIDFKAENTVLKWSSEKGRKNLLPVKSDLRD
jgi:hypothetical protein